MSTAAPVAGRPVSELARQPPPDDSLLVECDGENIESSWHRAAISLLIDSLSHHWRDRDDFFAGGNMIVYFDEEQTRGRYFRGPDFFVVKGVPRDRTRRWWAVWNEGWRYPDFVLELLSPSTEMEDRTTKKHEYERVWHTPEYFLHDPETGETEGWRLAGSDGHYERIAPNGRGWFWSDELQLWVGHWEGTYAEVIKPAIWPRFFTPDGQLVLTPAEANLALAEATQLRAEAAHEHLKATQQRADAAVRRADAEQERAEAEHRRAEAERQRAEAAEAELARLRALLSTRPDQAPSHSASYSS
jgi:Uma2 family endonuclease